jgi:hypothetical protein
MDAGAMVALEAKENAPASGVQVVAVYKNHFSPLFLVHIPCDNGSSDGGANADAHKSQHLQTASPAALQLKIF